MTEKLLPRKRLTTNAVSYRNGFQKLQCCQVAATNDRVPRAIRVSPRLRGACGDVGCYRRKFFGKVLKELINAETKSDLSKGKYVSMPLAIFPLPCSCAGWPDQFSSARTVPLSFGAVSMRSMDHSFERFSVSPRRAVRITPVPRAYANEPQRNNRRRVKKQNVFFSECPLHSETPHDHRRYISLRRSGAGMREAC